MSTTYVLMTALPPTKGHRNLMQFASEVADETIVIVCTQPDEPYYGERYLAISEAARTMRNVDVAWIHQYLPQEPEDDPGFWDMWKGFLVERGIKEGDFITASEPYGATLAEITGTTFIPYDIDRTVYNCKATRVRNDPYWHFDKVMPEFQQYLHRTVTIFGAESVGKTTLSRAMGDSHNTYWLPEWARPYMERYAPEVTTDTLNTIWRGQKALQISGEHLPDVAVTVQDTDLFSTVGYWRMFPLSNTPLELVNDALSLRSDLYIIPTSNIPFEPDPLRFGGDVRESSDQYWIDICEEFGLNYVVIDKQSRADREAETGKAIRDFYKSSVALEYERIGNH